MHLSLYLHFQSMHYMIIQGVYLINSSSKSNNVKMDGCPNFIPKYFFIPGLFFFSFNFYTLWEESFHNVF